MSIDASRRRFSVNALGLAASTALPGIAFAQANYPSHPITFIVPAAAGGTTDIAARMLSDPLGKELGTSVIVDNRAGASGNIAAMAVKNAPADGYTLLVQYSGYHVITPLVVKTSLKWDPVKDFLPVANILSAPQVVVIRSALPIHTMAELVAYCKANPGKLTFASSGNGSLQHVTGAMLEQQAGIKLVHVPYKGTGPALNDLLGGQVDMTFGTPPPFIAHINAGTLRALAVTGKSRISSLPKVPTTAEAGLPNLDASSWFAVFAPVGTPKPVVDKLVTSIKKVMSVDSFKQKATEQGAVADFMAPDQLGALAKTELTRWEAVVKSAHIEAD
jgi:tripartite-type tricarboxylate transporter receptor subunit TctC